MSLKNKNYLYPTNKLNADLLKLIHKDYIKPKYITLNHSKYKKILKKHGDKKGTEELRNIRDNLITLLNESYVENGIWVNEVNSIRTEYLIELISNKIIFTCVLMYMANDTLIINLTFYPNDHGSKSIAYNKKYGDRRK